MGKTSVWRALRAHRCAKPFLSLCAVVGSSVLTASGNLAITATKVDGEMLYFFEVVVLCAEILKFAASALGLALTYRKTPWTFNAKEFALFSVPAVLYGIDNNLVFVILQYIDPATLSVVWNIKIIQVAIAFRIVLKRKLTLLKWIAVLLLFCGVVASQSSKIHVTHQRLVCAVNSYEEESVFCLATPAAIANETMDEAVDATLTRVRATNSEPPSHYLLGILLLVVGTTISALAGIYTEWVMKRPTTRRAGDSGAGGASRSAASGGGGERGGAGAPAAAAEDDIVETNFFAQQAQFCFFGVVFNAVVLVARRGADIVAAKGNIFQNFTPLVFAVIAIITVNGLNTATIFKYLDNIMNIFTQAGSMLITAVVSALFFSFQPTVAFVAGFAVVLLAIFLYNASVEQLLGEGARGVSGDGAPRGFASLPEEEEDADGNGAIELQSVAFDEDLYDSVMADSPVRIDIGDSSGESAAASAAARGEGAMRGDVRGGGGARGSANASGSGSESVSELAAEGDEFEYELGSARGTHRRSHSADLDEPDSPRSATL